MKYFLHFSVASSSFEGSILQYANDNDVKGGFIRYTNFETVPQKCFNERYLHGNMVIPYIAYDKFNVMKPFLFTKHITENEGFFTAVSFA